mmetsp:Transcript_35658/g.65386  ORF Transcript_35658/g.65386 Transcript_35658/m.65386 type:complete len:118 (-) Transcript_35658:383-736(-)
MPAAPSVEHDLDKSPISSANIDHFCRVIYCTQHNYGYHSFSGGAVDTKRHTTMAISSMQFFCTLSNATLEAIEDGIDVSRTVTNFILEPKHNGSIRKDVNTIGDSSSKRRMRRDSEL